ncbi:hypothetical protein [Anabaena sp. UHCC 0253]|uniref:hypothetical protein n=1 Tax=Anabaena sp. UHCC 0253 TaxID=2590019 RepID=UPI00144609E0|nr:hypothetical protein [Anabaena sp. UHCC 0253]
MGDLVNSDRTPFNTPKSDRTPLQPQKRTDKSALALSHPLNFPTAIAPPQLPKSELTSQRLRYRISPTPPKYRYLGKLHLLILI